MPPEACNNAAPHKASGWLVGGSSVCLYIYICLKRIFNIINPLPFSSGHHAHIFQSRAVHNRTAALGVELNEQQHIPYFPHMAVVFKQSQVAMS